jgi:heme/copper-type cytochrome/quinol oxidase subunit 3
VSTAQAKPEQPREQEPRFPTTGEPISTIARRAKAGLWTLIVMDAAGTIAIVIAYSYLWSLNVNGGWAPPGASLTGSQTDESLPSTPPKATFAVEWPFWAILGLVIVSTVAMWFGYRELKRGNHAGMVVGTGASLVVAVGALVAQWIQISTFPFAAGDGAYASSVLLLCASNIFNLLILIFLQLGMLIRANQGLVTKAVHYQPQILSYWMVWLCIAFLLGAICTSFMVETPNTDPAIFGTFQQQS